MSDTPRCADCGALLDTATTDADSIDVECVDCGAPHVLHRFVEVSYYAERKNEQPMTSPATLLELQRIAAADMDRRLAETLLVYPTDEQRAENLRKALELCSSDEPFVGGKRHGHS